MTGEDVRVFVIRTEFRRSDSRKHRANHSLACSAAPVNTSCSETQLSSLFLKDLFLLFLFVYMSVYICHMCVHYIVYMTHVWRHPRWREKDIRYPGARVWGDYEQVWCWEANPGPLQEQVSQKAIFTSETSLSHSFKARSLGLIWNLTAFPHWLQTLKQNKTAQTLSWMK